MDDEVARASYLFAHFHQDCLTDDPDWESVIERFKEAESADSVRATREALLNLTGRLEDRELEALLFAPPCRSSYDPRLEGLTPRQWLEGIVHLLAGGTANASSDANAANARRLSVMIARDVLSGDKDILLASRELTALRSALGASDSDPDLSCFVMIDSETDALPLGGARALVSRGAAVKGR